MLHRGGALYPSHRPQRVRARRIPVFGSTCWPPISAPTVLEKAAAGHFQVGIAAARARGLRRKYFMRSRDPGIRTSSGRSRIASTASNFDGSNFMDADFGLVRIGGNHLLPQRHHLFRPAHAGRIFSKADPSTRARRLLLRRTFRVAARHGLAAGSRGSVRL